ncbi:MAG: hypothetical protein JO131_05155 [Gammaproteobacteria bacterium]|nr:hypothetical protein [Gammaproteobacteria bacterium]
MRKYKWFLSLFLALNVGNLFAQNMPLVTVTFKDSEHLCQGRGLPLLVSYTMANNSNPNKTFTRMSNSSALTDGDFFTINPKPGYTYINFSISGQPNYCGNLEYISAGGSCERNLSEEFPKNTANIIVTPKKAPLTFDPDGGYTLDCTVSGS